MTKTDLSSTTRFSDRVKNYSLYRPSYPVKAIRWIIKQYNLNAQSVVADIGSGTGIFTQLLMDAGLRVTAIEPNLNMRLESDRLHSANPLYSSLNGTAESTELDSNSINVVTAAQAGHWFDLEKSMQEFQRILRPKGVLVFIWNRRNSASSFQKAYESLLRTLPEYNHVNHGNVSDAQLAGFFKGEMQRKTFANNQEFNLAGFRGRVFSSSYTPGPKNPAYEQFSRKVDELFFSYSKNNKLVFTYDTQVYAGYIQQPLR